MKDTGKKRIATAIALSSILLLAAGCGSDGVSHGQGEYYGSASSSVGSDTSGGGSYLPPPGDYEDEAESPKKLAYGYLYDSAVTGAFYECGAEKGKTDSSGRFFCPLGTEATFYVGKAKIGTYPADREKIGVVTPSTLLGHPIDEVPLYDRRFLAVISLLQGLDEDSYYRNGIDIAKNAYVIGEPFDLTDRQEVSKFLSRYASVLENPNTAWKNYVSSLSDLGIKNPKIFTDPLIKEEWEWYGGAPTSLNLGNLYLDYHGENSRIVFVVPDFPSVSLANGCSVTVVNAGGSSVFPDIGSGDAYTTGSSEYESMIDALCAPRDGEGYAGILSGTEIVVVKADLSETGDLRNLMETIRSRDPDAVVISSGLLKSGYMPTEYEYNETNPSLISFPMFAGTPGSDGVKVTGEKPRPINAFSFYPQTLYTVPLDRYGVADGYKNAPGDVAAPGSDLGVTGNLISLKEDMASLMAAAAYVIGKERHPSVSWCNLRNTLFSYDKYAVAGGEAGGADLGEFLSADVSAESCAYEGPSLPGDLFADKGTDETPPTPPPPPPSE